MSGNLQHVSNMPKGLMMYGSDGAGGHASSTNQLVRTSRFITFKTINVNEISESIFLIPTVHLRTGLAR